MKADIHPTYHTDAKITCVSCGTSHDAGSVLPEIKIEVCSSCHPFYTGQQDHLVDTTGRVDKFKARMEKAKAMQAQNAPENDVEEEVNEEDAKDEAKDEVKDEAQAEETSEETTEETSEEEEEEEKA